MILYASHTESVAIIIMSVYINMYRVLWVCDLGAVRHVCLMFMFIHIIWCVENENDKILMGWRRYRRRCRKETMTKNKFLICLLAVSTTCSISCCSFFVCVQVYLHSMRFSSGLFCRFVHANIRKYIVSSLFCGACFSLLFAQHILYDSSAWFEFTKKVSHLCITFLLVSANSHLNVEWWKERKKEEKKSHTNDSETILVQSTAHRPSHHMRNTQNVCRKTVNLHIN